MSVGQLARTTRPAKRSKIRWGVHRNPKAAARSVRRERRLAVRVVARRKAFNQATESQLSPLRVPPRRTTTTGALCLEVRLAAETTRRIKRDAAAAAGVTHAATLHPRSSASIPPPSDSFSHRCSGESHRRGRWGEESWRPERRLPGHAERRRSRRRRQRAELRTSARRTASLNRSTSFRSPPGRGASLQTPFRTPTADGLPPSLIRPPPVPEFFFCKTH